MTVLRSALRLARDVGTTTRVRSDRRDRWRALLRAGAAQYWPELRSPLTIELDRRVRQGAGGRTVRGTAADGRIIREFWVKWCPHADPCALEQSAAHMRLWRSLHAELLAPVANVLDHWPEANVLLIEGRPGESLDRILAARGHNLEDQCHKYGTKLGRWLRAYAAGRGTYDRSVEPLLGDDACRVDGGGLRVNARRLIENRLELAGRAVHELVERGYAAARHWADRRDPDNLVASFSDSEPGGFIHGDFKPGNILFDECGFSIIDWWTTPRVSWPLQDPAMLAANLRMGNRGAAARQVWNSFANAYFDARLDERTAAAIDLLATMTCLSFVAGKTRRGGGRLLDKRWCAKFVLALAEGQSILDSVR